MKKSVSETKNSYSVVASTITATPVAYTFIFTQDECQALADRFEVPKVLSFHADLTLFRDEFVHVRGKIDAQMIRQSVISLDEFQQNKTDEFEVLYSENPPEKSEEIIDKIDKGRIDLKMILFEQFGLALEPFPKKPEEEGGFIYQEENTETTNPFQQLKKIIK